MAFEILKHQLDFISSTARHTGLVGGFRSGKSHSGVLKTISKKLKLPKVDVAYYLPTYPLIRDIAFPKFTEILTQQNIPFNLNKSDKDIITPYGRIILRSMDNPTLIIGYEVGYSLVDEADVLSTKKMQEIMIKILARNSVKTLGNNNATDFVSTPEGFKFLYNFFVKNDSKNKKLIQARTEDNPFISEDYIDSLKEQYTQQQLDAYLNGEFVNLTSGTVYHAFDRQSNHSDREIQPRDVLHVGMDFNITKMSAVIHVTDAKIITAVEEITNAYDTAEMISIIKVRYPKQKIVVYPDASGNARNTAGDSDIKLLRKAKFTVRVDKSNPSVRDRITSVNSAFKNSKGETTYYVNTNNCIDYTEALEKLPYKNGVPDKESGFDHVTDGGGYALYQINKGKNTIRINV